jgi:predicted anti-sigma-YlaC factor YlaD
MALRFHLLMCDACRNFASQMELLSKATKLWPTKAKTENTLSTDARERIAKQLADKQKVTTKD